MSAGEPTYYGLGWMIRPVENSANRWHAGSLPGTRSLLVRTHHDLVWAAVFNSLPQGGREYYRAKQTHATMTHLVRIYWSPEVEDVTAKYWVMLGSRRLDIVAATNVDEASQFIDLVCVEKVE